MSSLAPFWNEALAGLLHRHSGGAFTDVRRGQRLPTSGVMFDLRSFLSSFAFSHVAIMVLCFDIASACAVAGWTNLKPLVDVRCPGERDMARCKWRQISPGISLPFSSELDCFTFAPMHHQCSTDWLCPMAKQLHAPDGCPSSAAGLPHNCKMAG